MQNCCMSLQNNSYPAMDVYHVSKSPEAPSALYPVGVGHEYFPSSEVSEE